MPFSYQPLPTGSKAIRLLHVQPGRGKDRIQCSLQPSMFPPLDRTYEALSYRWGDARKTIPILVNGLSIEVTENLHAALLHLRLKDETRVLWADALCINQGDDAEKSEQVQMMREIYQYGAKTLVWLGQLPFRAHRIFRSIPILNTGRRSRWNLSLRDSDILLGIRALLENPYFNRMWIIQEIAVSASIEVHCSDSSVSWNDLAAAVSIAYKNGPNEYGESFFQYMRSFSCFESIADVRSQFQGGSRIDWLRLLARHRDFSATNAKDKVYALLGLIRPEVVLRLRTVPDYRDDYTVEQAFKDTAIGILKTTNNLDLLSVLGPFVQDSAERRLPTWVPDWRKPAEAWSLLPLAGDPNFAATKNSPSRLGFQNSSKAIGLTGYTFDEIDWVGYATSARPTKHASKYSNNYFSEVYSFMSFGARNLRAWKDWRDHIATHFHELNANGEDLAAIFWKTFTCGNSSTNERDGVHVESPTDLIHFIGDWTPPSGLADFAFIWQAYFVSRALGDAFPTMLGTTRPSVRDKSFQMSCGRRMFTTKRQYIGLGPSGIRTGDCLALLEGGRVPYVLRRKGEMHELVGDCYVHGIMHGEIFDGTSCRQIWLI